MTNIEFREEIHKHMDQLYDEFLHYQENMFDVLCEFDRICKLNEIKYYLAYGTLLGAIRDKGLIPWDYDVDVMLSIEDRDKLISSLKNDLGAEYCFDCSDINKHSSNFFVRITKKGYDYTVLHLDVYYIIGVPKDEKKRIKFTEKIRKICMVRIYKTLDCKKCSMGVYKKFLYMRLKQLIYRIIYPSWYVEYKTKKVVYKYDYKKSEYVRVLTDYKLNCFKKEYLGEAINVTINGKEFYVPEFTEKFLNDTYLDYKKYPAIETKFNEFFDSIKLIHWFQNSNISENKNDLYK